MWLNRIVLLPSKFFEYILQFHFISLLSGVYEYEIVAFLPILLHTLTFQPLPQGDGFTVKSITENYEKVTSKGCGCAPTCVTL